MAKKKKIERDIKRDEKNPSTPRKSIIKIPFQVWFNSKVSKKQLNPHQVPEIIIFFKKRGLSELEEVSKYESVLKEF